MHDKEYAEYLSTIEMPNFKGRCVMPYHLRCVLHMKDGSTGYSSNMKNEQACDDYLEGWIEKRGLATGGHVEEYVIGIGWVIAD